MDLDVKDPFKASPDRGAALDVADPFAASASSPAPSAAPVASPVKRPSSVLRRTVGDAAVDLGRGIIGAGEAAVGLANIPTFGMAGKALESVGYQPAVAKDMIGELHSPERKAAQAKVAEADGFIDTAKTMIQNPSTIAGTVVESLPTMLGGGAIAQGVRKLAPRVGMLGSAAIGEGAAGAGAAAEGIRQETEDGTLNATQVGASIGTGIGTGVLGAAGGSLARKLGIADVDVLAAGGGMPLVTRPGSVAARTARGAVGGAVAEGVLEELPQSVQEQVWQNVALERPAMEGVPEAAATGLLAGAAMGGPIGAVSAARARPETPDADAPPPGSMAEAANVIQNPTLALPAPVIRVRPDGKAASEATIFQREQRIAQQRRDRALAEDAELVSEREALGLTPDVNAARARHPAAAPNMPFPMARPGSLADAGNAIAAAQPTTAPAPQPMAAAMPRGDATGNAAYEGRDVSTNLDDDTDLAARPPINLDPETGEELSIDAERWPAAQEHQQPGTIVRALVAQAAQNKNKPAGVTSIAKTFNISMDTARALRNRALDTMNAEAGSSRRIEAPAQGTLQPEGGEATSLAGDTMAAEPAAATQPAPTAAMGTEQAASATYDETDELLDTDTGSPSGGPFTIRDAADLAAAKVEGGRVFPVESGFVVRTPRTIPQGESSEPQGAPSLPSAPATTPAPVSAESAAAPLGNTSVRPEADALPAVAVDTGSSPSAQATPAAPAEQLAVRANEAATSPQNDRPAPTQAQKDAGNYAKGHVRLNGHDISIENPAGSKRDPKWPALKDHYGYIRGTIGKDKDHVDVFMTENAHDEARPVFVVDQVNKDGSFDEHKVVMGAADEAEARAAYLRNYSKGWTGLGAITQMSQDEFKSWVRDQKKTRRPAGKLGKPAKRANAKKPKADAEIQGESAKKPAPRRVEVADNGLRVGDRVTVADDRRGSYEATITAIEANAAPAYGGTAFKVAQDDAKPDGRGTGWVGVDRVTAAPAPSTDAPPPARRARAKSEPATPAPAVVDALGEIAEGGFAESILRNLDDAGARAAAKAMGFTFSGSAKAASIANNLAGRSQADVREAAEKAYRTHATAEQQQARDDSRPARHAAANAKVASREQEAELRRREHRGLLVRENGEPFKTEHAAQKLLGELPATGEFAADGFGIYRTDGGFGLRRWPTTGVGAVEDGFLDKETATRKRDEARAAYARDRGMEIDRFGNFVPATAAQEPSGRRHDDIDIEREAHEARRAETAKASAGKATATKQHRASRLAILGDGWKARSRAPGDGPARHVFERKSGDRSAQINEGRFAEGNFEVTRGLRDANRRWHPGNGGTEYFQTFDEAVAYANGHFGAAEPTPEGSDDPGKIDDFGETLHGARKHLYAESYRDTLRTAGQRDIASSTLTQSWPAPDYQKLLDDGAAPWAVAFVHAARDEIPTKPTSSWKVKGWAAQVSALRAFSTDLLTGKLEASRARELLRQPEYALVARFVGGRADLYEAIGHDVSLKGVRLEFQHYMLYRGQKDVSLWVVDKAQKATAFSNWPRELATGKTREEAISALRKRVDELKAEQDAQAGKVPRAGTVRFNVYANRLTKEIFIGVKIGKGVVTVQGGFKTSTEARTHVLEHRADLETKLAKMKEVPEIRRGNNSPRVGIDHRAGADVTPDRFLEAFGFRGVQFGNYVEGPRRQRDLNEAFDALMDLAGVLDIQPRALSLDGQLGLAFGARGTGGKSPASAHYEPDKAVINLTKGAGAGSLAHEWFHGLDNYFATLRQGRNSFTYATDVATGRDAGDLQNMRGEMMRAFQRVMNTIHDTGLRARSQEMDKVRRKPYWSTGIEMAARSFEGYVIAKLADQGAANDYLANVVSEQAFSGENYPYPNASELPAVRAAFDDFFSTVEQEDTPEGNVRLFSKAEDTSFYSALLRSVETAKGAPRRATPAAWKQWLDGAQRRGELKQEERDWLGVDGWLEGQESVTREALAAYVRANQVQVQDVELSADRDDARAIAKLEAFEQRMTEKYGPRWHSEMEAEEEHERELLMSPASHPEAKYAAYQLPGGTSYRELLLTLPEVSASDAARRAELRAKPLDSMTPAERAELANLERGRGASGDRGLYRSGHFDQSNVLAHVRFNERIDADGKRVLFLEEIQSDWHQQGRRRGYGRKWVVRYGNAQSDNPVAVLDTEEEAQARTKELNDAIPDDNYGYEYREEVATPEAPFKTTWPMLAFKRMVRYAADHGFERIAWTTGEQQAERYDLSKQVREVEYVDGRNLIVRDLNGAVIYNETMAEDGIAAVIGKDPAKALVAAPKVRRDGFTIQTIMGDGLKVGGDGMRAFYDRMLPNEVGKLVRRFGAKVGQTTISPQEPKQAAITWDGARNVEPGVGVHSVDITADLRRAALGGQPLFSQRGAGEGGAHLTYDRALQIKADVTGQWGENAPTVILVENAEGFPNFAKVDPDYRRGEGLFNGRQTVWINVGGIRTERRFAEVLAHEAIGHYGVENVVGQEEWQGIVEAIERHRQAGTGAESLQSAIKSVQRRYGDIDALTFAKETIAVLAEQGAKNGILDRVVASVRRWLRQHMPRLVDGWKDADIVALLGQAESFLRAGRSQAESRQAVGALAFSRGTRNALNDAAEFASKVRRFIAGNLSGSAPIRVTQGTPDVLRKLGEADRPFIILRGKLDQIRRDHPEITEPVLTELVRHLHEPVAIFRSGANSTNPSGMVALTELEIDGKPVMIALYMGVARGDGVVVNRVASYYGKETRDAFLKSVGELLYIDQSKTPPWLTSGLQLPKVLSTSRRGSGQTVLTDADVVKPFSDGSGQYSKAPVQVQMDGRGDRRIHLGGETFLQRGDRFYMVNGTGHPKDFHSLQTATAAAQRTGGEVRLEDPVDGHAATWSVVVPDLVAREAGAGRPLFSKAPPELLEDVEAVMAGSHREGIFERAKQFLKDATPKKIKDELRGSWLGALTTRHLTELGQDYFQNIRHYSDFLAEQQADRNKLQAEDEAVVERARKWAGKNRAESRRLFDLMHQATIDGVDPAEEYKPLQFFYGGQLREATNTNVKEALKAIREQMRGRGADNKTDMMAEAKMLRDMPARERARRKKYPTLVERWAELSPDAQAVYREFRDSYAARSDAVEAALIARINDTDAPENHKRKLINTIRQQFETQRLSGVYFPLQRFGRYFVAAEKGDGSTFLMFEKLSELERAVKSLKERGFKVTAQGLKSEGRAQDAPSGTFVAEIIEQLKKSGVSNQTQDQIYQMYLQTLPELSMRKHAIHRKSVPGFDPDAIRAFAYNAAHGAHQLSRLRFGHKMQNVLDLLKKQQDAARKEEGADTRRIAAGDAILEELNKRHEWINNPQDSNLTNLVSSFGFTYYLGLTPAAALVNITQTPLISYPYLAARYGGAKAMNALLKGVRDAARTGGNIQRTLRDPDELRAHAALQSMGAIDKTQAHNLAGIAEGGLSGYNPTWARAMEIVGWGFHRTEVVNREATGMAAFRLARAAGETFEAAVKVAADTIYDTHYDYSNANRARFMQSGTAKVLLMFRQYSLNTTWHLARMVWQATKGEKPEVRAIARRNLAGILGMAGVFAGVLGLPMVKASMGVLNAIAASFGDDDEPWDAETEFRAFLTAMLGQTGAETLLTGPTNLVTGADIHSRVSLSGLWFRDADRELDGRGQYYHLLEQAAGPMGGVLKNALVGKSLIDEGHVWRGIETMLPKAVKDGMKSIRYATQGVNNMRGDPVLEDPSLWQAMLQLQGFTPAQVSQRYEANRSLKNYEQHILSRRQHLMDALAMSLRLNDTHAYVDTMDKVNAFNRAHPQIGITTASIRASMKSRARYSARAEGGIVLNPKIAASVRARVEGTE